MRLTRVLYQGSPHFAYCDERGEHMELLSAAPWLGGQPTGERAEDAVPLAPVAPSKIVCVGRNYRAHAEELGQTVPAEPLLFLKPPSALLEHGGVIELPDASEQVEHEGELGVVLGKRLRDATPAEARAAIYGLTCVNDVTARDLQRRDVQFTRAKSFDTFCPCGPHVVTGLDPSALSISVYVNEERRQAGNTADMIWPVDALLAYISSVMTLEPGDLVSTGTPAGVGPIGPGDVVIVEIEGVGRLESGVALRL